MLNTKDNLKITRATHLLLGLNKNFTQFKKANKSLFWHLFSKKYFATNFPFNWSVVMNSLVVRSVGMNSLSSIIQENHTLRNRSISHCISHSHFFLLWQKVLVFKCYLDLHFHILIIRFFRSARYSSQSNKR